VDQRRARENFPPANLPDLRCLHVGCLLDTHHNSNALHHGIAKRQEEGGRAFDAAPQQYLFFAKQEIYRDDYMALVYSPDASGGLQLRVEMKRRSVFIVISENT